MAAPELFVREAGQGPPLVLLHGLASSSRYWEPHFATLGRFYRVVAPDLLGFGHSPHHAGLAYTAAEHLDALIPAIERRVNGAVTLVGHSMGTLLALQLVITRPELVKRLLLVSLPVMGGVAWGHHADGRPDRLHRFSVHTRAGRVLFGAGMRLARPAGRAISRRIQREIPRGAAEDTWLSTWASYWDTLESVVYDGGAPALFDAARGPLLLLHGAEDGIAPISPVRELVQRRADARLIEVARAGHNPCYTHPAVFYAVLRGDAERPGGPLEPASRAADL